MVGESTYVLGAMVPASLPIAHATENVSLNARPLSTNRQLLRHISSLRNAWTLVFLYLQTISIMWGAITYPLFGIPIAFVLMGRAHAQFASLMHESAHRVLFANKRINDTVGRWLPGFVVFTSTDAYRRVHMAHHREEFGPNEPDIPLYANYPITSDSFWRKMRRDAVGITGFNMIRDQFRHPLRKDGFGKRTQAKILVTQLVLLVSISLVSHPVVYVAFWFIPQLTVWRVMNRLRSIAEHGGLRADDDRRVTTHSVRQHPIASFLFVPFNLGWHIAHHADSGIPFRSLPKYHHQLRASGFVTDTYEYGSYLAIWRALRSRPEAIASAK